MTLELTEEEKIYNYKKDEEQYERQMDDLYDGFDEWKSSALQELMEDFCEGNDDFNVFCQEQWKQFKDD